MGGRGASSSKANELVRTWNEAVNERRSQLQSTLLNNFVDNRNVIRELEANIRAQKAYNPNAKVGDTRIDSDRMISLYSERLTPQEYSVFTQEAAETALFRKLRELERKAGFKK